MNYIKDYFAFVGFNRDIVKCAVICISAPDAHL
jgi:hypothetical protein